MKPTSRVAVIALSVFSLSWALPAHAGTQMATGAAVVPPAGFIGFCAKHLQDCMTKSKEPVVVELTEVRRHELDAVQTAINTTVKPREEPAHVWDYPTDGYGDCNRFALAKRKELIARGWPQEALLLATATTERGEGHLVVVARTDQGDLVLDNRLAPVVDWTALPYHWISVQNQRNPLQWVSILSQPIATADASAAVRSSPADIR